MSVRVSVVIPSYNHARWVAEAVRSALAQEVDGLEVVVVDDGSSDDSVAVVRGIVDPRLRLFEQENLGAHRAFDRGLREARGEYVALLNSDDRYRPGRLRRALRCLADEPKLGLVGSWVQVIDGDGKPLAVKQGFHNLDPWPVPDPGRTFKADLDLRTALLLQNYWATTSNYVMPRKSYERFGPFRPLRFAHDWDFALRVQRETPAWLIEEPLLEYRVHDANTIHGNRAWMVYEICWVLAVHLPRYLAGAEFWRPGRARRAEQLLRSIHVYGCESVLLGMLALINLGPPGSEEALLDPDDPVRQTYLDEIRGLVARADGQAEGVETRGLGRRLRALLRAVGR